MHRLLSGGTIFRSFLCVACFAASIALLPASAEEQNRGAGGAPSVALLIGNSNYPDDDLPLKQPVNDARLLANELRRRGFEAAVGENLTKEEMKQAIDAFFGRIKPNSVALIYFSGHAIQTAAHNYMIPVNAQIWTEAEVRRDGVDMQSVLDEIHARGAGLKIAIIDASRRNPWERRFRHSPRGLAPVIGKRGSLVIYAAAPETVVKDGEGENSLFMRELLKEIQVPRTTVEQAFSRTRTSVAQASKGEQVPWVSSFLSGDVYINPTERQTSATPPPPPPPRSDPCAAAEVHWKSAESINTQMAFQDHLTRFPDCPFAGLAKARIEALKNIAAARVPAQPVAPPTPVQPAVGVFASSRPAKPLSLQEERGLKPKDSFKECEACPEMVVVPAGSFRMGSPDTESGRDKEEGPVHLVTIARPFAVGRFAITFDEWEACVNEGGCNRYRPSDRGWGRGQRPVIYVSWNDVRAYLAWLSRKTGKAYRLLSEAEREYSTRAGTTTPFWWGSTISTEQANYNGNRTYGDEQIGENRQKTVAVQSFMQNPWGLYQVHGNVWEWVEDCWNLSYEGAPTDGSAWTSGDCSQRVHRGGSWYGAPQHVRSAVRGNERITVRHYMLGFRVARSLTP